MPALVTAGRILFVLIFVFSGASKLFDIASTTQAIADKVIPALPAMVTPYTAQLESLTRMPTAQLLAILVGVLEVVGGLMIALNFGARLFSILLVIFVAIATYYFHNFWDMTGIDRTNNMIHVLKNLSIIGGLLIIAGTPRTVVDDSNYTGSSDMRY